MKTTLKCKSIKSVAKSTKEGDIEIRSANFTGSEETYKISLNLSCSVEDWDELKQELMVSLGSILILNFKNPQTKLDVEK